MVSNKVSTIRNGNRVITNKGRYLTPSTLFSVFSSKIKQYFKLLSNSHSRAIHLGHPWFEITILEANLSIVT